MDIVTALALIVCGSLAAATLLVQKKPNAQQLLDKITPYQGIIGVIVAIWGVWIVIFCLLHISAIRYVPFWFLIYLLTGIVEILLGFLLGYALIAKYAIQGS